MAKIESTIRPYDVLLAPDLGSIEPKSNKTINSLFAETVDWYNRTSEIFFDLFLTLSGGITPRIASLINKRNPAEICALSWFSLESIDAKKPLMDGSQMKRKFQQHWKILSDDSHNADLLLDFNYNKERYGFVDRRNEFHILNKKLNLTDKDMELFFTTPAFPFFGQEEGNPHFWRTFFSNVFGTGEKADVGLKADVFNRLLAYRPIWKSTTIGELRQNVFKCFKVSNMDDFKAVAGFNRGASNFLVLRLESNDSTQLDQKGLDNLKKLMQERVESLQLQKNRPAYSPAVQSLLKYLEDKIGIPFKLEQYAKAATLAWRRILSSKNASFTQLQTKQELAASESVLSGKFVKILTDFETEQAKKLGIMNYEVRAHQLNGIAEVFAQALNTDDFEAALSTAQANMDGKFGHHDLFRYLNEKKCIASQNSYKDIVESVEKLALMRKINSLRLPGITHITSERPVKPEFGASSPLIKLQSTNINGQDILSHVTLNLWNGSEFINVVDIPVYGKRAKREVFFHNPKAKHQVFRNNALNYNKNANVSSSPLEKGVCGASLFTNDKLHEDTDQKKWYLRLSPKLTYEKPKLPVLGERKLKVLAVDLGWRNPATYALLEKDNKGKIIGLNKNQDELFKARYIESGKLDHKLLSPDDHAYYSVFSPVGKPATKSQRDLCQEFLSRIFEKDFKFDENADLLQMLYVLSLKIKRYIYKQQASVLAFDMLRNLITLLSPKFAAYDPKLKLNSGKSNHHSGTLSWKRIDTITNTISAVNCYLSLAQKLKKAKSENEQMLETALRSMQDKLNSIRQERYRITANMIMQKAKELKVDCVVLRDDGGMKVSRTNFASDNQKIARWYTSRIYRQVEENLMPIGIFVNKVDPSFTSHRDLNDEDTVVYMYYKPSKQLTKFEERLRNRYDSYCRLKSPGPVQSLYIAAIKKLYAKFNAENFDEFRKALLKNKVTNILVPLREGHIALSVCLNASGKKEEIDIDELSAAVIAKRFLVKLANIKAKYNLAA